MSIPVLVLLKEDADLHAILARLVQLGLREPAVGLSRLRIITGQADASAMADFHIEGVAEVREAGRTPNGRMPL